MWQKKQTDINSFTTTWHWYRLLCHTKLRWRKKLLITNQSTSNVFIYIFIYTHYSCPRALIPKANRRGVEPAQQRKGTLSKTELQVHLYQRITLSWEARWDRTKESPPDKYNHSTIALFTTGLVSLKIYLRGVFLSLLLANCKSVFINNTQNPYTGIHLSDAAQPLTTHCQVQHHTTFPSWMSQCQNK